MRKIRVGLIDSGINQCVIEGKVTQEIFCGREDDAYGETDINGHGTMCAGMIERMAVPEVEFVSAKIFPRELKATERQIIEALTYMTDMRVDIINMSLSVSLSDSAALEKICSQLNEMGVILVSASANSGKRTLFESYGNVITVAGSSFFDGTAYWYRGSNAVCDIEPVLLPWYENEYSFFGGNSKAAALFTAIVVNAENMQSKTFDINYVKRNAGRRVWKKTDLHRDGAGIPFAKPRGIHYAGLIERKELMRCVERVTGIPMIKWEREADWYAGGTFLTANQVQNILKELIAKNVLKIERNAEIFMEYFRNKENFFKFMGC